MTPPVFVCSVRWREIVIDVFRVGAIRFAGALRGVFQARAFPPGVSKLGNGVWFRTVKEAVALFGVSDGRYEWAPGEQRCTVCNTLLSDLGAHGLGCEACAAKEEVHPAFCGCSDCPS